jgi:transglutaminase-like putative cysteine protease
MRITIDYSAKYRYEKAVSFSPHAARIFPRSDTSVRYRSLEFRTNEAADVQFRRDIFDNEFALCFYPAIESQDLVFDASFELDLTHKNPFHFLVSPHAMMLPFEYTAEERRALGPALVPEPGEENFALPFWPRPDKPISSVEALTSVTDAIFANIAYERRETGEARTAAETIALKSGACRDTSLLMAAALKGLGLATRLASGYLCELPGAESMHAHKAEGAFHAWVETFLPGAGWIGLDGTNGIFCDHTFIATAVGFSPADITPISGSYYGRDRVASELTSSLKIREQLNP